MSLPRCALTNRENEVFILASLFNRSSLVDLSQVCVLGARTSSVRRALRWQTRQGAAERAAQFHGSQPKFLPLHPRTPAHSVGWHLRCHVLPAPNALIVEVH